jgi:hypothetical protein
MTLTRAERASAIPTVTIVSVRATSPTGEDVSFDGKRLSWLNRYRMTSNVVLSTGRFRCQSVCRAMVCLLVLPVLSSACTKSRGAATSASAGSVSVSASTSPSVDLRSHRIAMQQRQVIAIVSRTSPQWSKTPATCGPNAATLTHCIAATRSGSSSSRPGPITTSASSGQS